MGKLKAKTFQSFCTNLLEMNVPIHKLVSVTTDGAPAMINEDVGLIGLCKGDRGFPASFTCHSGIRQQAACTEVIDFQRVM
jgi:hypothetical protein